MRKSRALGTHPRGSSSRPIDLERSILQELCHARLTRPAWAKVASGLREYAWSDVEHGLVYAAIQRIGYGNPQTLCEQLPAQATRMGFPDIDWQAYFSRKQEGVPTPSVDRIVRQIRRLIQAVRTNPTPSGHRSVRRRHSAQRPV
jgi:hypothetical protein